MKNLSLTEENNMRIVLASKFPRRKELLKILFDEFEIIPDNKPENKDDSLDPEVYVVRLAEDKCINVAEGLKDSSLVIAADTVVVKDGKILGKPENEADAAYVLKMLSGSVHSVYTGVCVFDNEKKTMVSFFEKTDVHFYELSNETIENYVKTGEPMDKAGSYGIQEKGALFVEKVVGDYNNVVGLPIARLNMILKEKFGISPNFNI